MKKIARLDTRDGGFVIEIKIPDLQPPAEVVIWGSRVFVLQTDPALLGAAPEARALHYREGMAWHATPETEVRP